MKQAGRTAFPGTFMVVEGLGAEDVEEVLHRLDGHRPLVLGFRGAL